MNIITLANIQDLPFDKPLESFSDRLSAAGQVVLLGMLAVFAVLALLWVVLAIMGKFFTKTPAQKSSKKTEAPAVETPAVTETAQVAEDTANDEEIVAAITAAITLMLEAENAPGTSKGFRVVSFKRTSNNAHWNHRALNKHD